MVIAHGGSELEWFESFLHPKKTCTADDCEDIDSERWEVGWRFE